MDRYSPVTSSALINHLAEDFFLNEDEQRRFRQMARLLGQLVAHFARQRLEPVEQLYKIYDPDSETIPTPTKSIALKHDDLFELLNNLFQDANFQRLTDETLVELARNTPSVKGTVKLDFKQIERFALFHRGVGTRVQVTRPFKRYFKKVETEIATYSRVVIVSRTTEDPHITIHLYKNVIQEDVELLLPTINIKMKLLDRFKLSGASGSAFISAVKLLRTLVIQVPKFLALPFKVILIPMMIIIGIVYGGKALLDYSKIKSQYIEALRENLYKLNIAKNAAVLSSLKDEITEETIKSILLAWTFLHKSPQGMKAQQLRKAIARYTKRCFVVPAEPNEERALELLREYHLLVEPRDGRQRVAGLDEAIWTLDHTWDELFQAPGRL